MARTVYTHTNSNGASREIDANEAKAMLACYHLAYYSLANDCNGGKGFGIGQDMLGGKIVHVVACKLDTGRFSTEWLSASAGSDATARKIMSEWEAVRPSREAI